jgi:hypothetical protein
MPYGEFYDIYSVSSEYFGNVLDILCQLAAPGAAN